MKLKKTIFSLLVVTIFALGFSVSAFASDTENSEIVAKSTTATIQNVEEKEIVTRAVVDGTVPSNGTMNLYPVLNSYVGFTKQISILTTPMSTRSPSGYLKISMYKPNGSLLKVWKTVLPEDQILETFTLPSSGTYTLKIESKANVPVFVSATWVKNS